MYNMLFQLGLMAVVPDGPQISLMWEVRTEVGCVFFFFLIHP